MLLNSKGGERREVRAEVEEGRRGVRQKGGKKKEKKRRRIQLLLWMGARFQFDS